MQWLKILLRPGLYKAPTFYDSVSDEYIQDGFQISEFEEDGPVPWHPWSLHNPDDSNPDEDGHNSKPGDDDQEDSDSDDNHGNGGGNMDGDHFMADLNADNFYDGDGPPIHVDGRLNLYADVEVDYTRMVVPTAGEDTDSVYSVGPGDSFHSFSSQSSEFTHNTESYFPDDASDLNMPVSVYAILDVPPSEDILNSSTDASESESRSSCRHARVATRSRVTVGSASDSSASSVKSSPVRRFDISVSKAGRNIAKKSGPRKQYSSDSAPSQLHIDSAPSDSDEDAHFILHFGWRMRIDDEDFDHDSDSYHSSATSDTSSKSRKRCSDDSNGDKQRSDKKRACKAAGKEVEDLFQALGYAWTLPEVELMEFQPKVGISAQQQRSLMTIGISAKEDHMQVQGEGLQSPLMVMVEGNQLNGFAVVEPDQPPLLL
ncbi:OLC1v1000749C1 [Oldenlandia corymbosa var. corymbosa]|uniref:OLC1v1000749C1 n=1 Tax=Oldenlandia corymbosa var. corymbosa TaxID=529605 RepID=A0AAV1D3Z8_OLDCO|nr:OLC1v1000749C1 [Oldenlandia corymbosa var. corymbosa]